MKNIFFTLITLISFQSFSQQEVPLFNQLITMGGSSSETIFSTTTDNSGNIYSTGTFIGIADFDPGAGVFNLTSMGDRDVFIQKTDALGNLLWAKSIGGSLFDVSSAIKTDNNGNIYIGGAYKNTVDFDPGIAITSLTSTGEYDTFVLKLNSNGDFVWVKSIGGSFDDLVNDLDVDNIGNIYCSGHFYGTVDFDPNGGVSNNTSNGSYDAFIQKLDANGNLVWAKTFGGSSVDMAYGINIDFNNSILLTGRYRNTVDFNPGVNTFNLSSNGNYDIFVLKLDVNGNFSWATSIGSSLEDKGTSITTDANGNVFYTGFYRSTVDFDPSVGTENITSIGDADCFVQKLDANGNYLWTKTIGGTGYDIGNSVATNINGDIFTIGSYSNSVDLDPSVNTNTVTSNGLSDVFIQKLTSNGNYKWATSYGSSSYDSGNSILVNDNNNVTCSGDFSNTVDFDPTTNIENATSVGLYDAYTLTLSQCQTTNTVDVQSACNSFTWVDGITYTTNNNTATYTYTNQGGCDSTLFLDLTINIIDLSITNNSPTLMSNANNATYQWVDCDNGNSPIANETNQTFITTNNGNFAVEVTLNGCTLLSNCITVSNVGLLDNSINFISQISPNPTDGIITINMLKNYSIEKIIIFDVTGKEITNDSYSMNNFEINLLGENGFYFVKIITKSGEFSIHKILKQ